ncbi:MAG: metallophosphoesterase [Acetatifactor sp.]
MATYVMSDIHGEYDMFVELLEEIELGEEDVLYILGDILDRGPHPIKLIFKLMEMPNVICLVGNHELMALECLKFLMQEITEDSIGRLDENLFGNLLSWQENGGGTTIREFIKLNREERQEVIDFIKDFFIYEELTVHGKEFLLVHAGLGNYSPEKEMEDYSLKELVWDRAEYGVQYFQDAYVVTGHTPTQMISENPNPGCIFRRNNHIALDCGAYFPGGRLAAICLDTGEEFYSSPNETGG